MPSRTPAFSPVTSTSFFSSSMNSSACCSTCADARSSWGARRRGARSEEARSEERAESREESARRRGGTAWTDATTREEGDGAARRNSLSARVWRRSSRVALVAARFRWGRVASGRAAASTRAARAGGQRAAASAAPLRSRVLWCVVVRPSIRPARGVGSRSRSVTCAVFTRLSSGWRTVYSGQPVKKCAIWSPWSSSRRACAGGSRACP